MNRTQLASAIAFLMVSAAYVYSALDLVLLLIPLISLTASRFVAPAWVRKLVAAFFLLHFLAASAMLFTGMASYEVHGALALIYLFTAVLLAYLDWLGSPMPTTGPMPKTKVPVRASRRFDAPARPAAGDAQ